MVIAFIQSYPHLCIIGIAIIVSFFIQFVNFLVLNKDAMRDLKQKQKDLREQMKLHKDNVEKQKELSGQLLSHSMESMRHSFKPMLITMLPALVVLWFIKSEFSQTTIASSWIWYYIITALVSGIVFRKLFKLP